jgi:hypothetical protein
MLTIGACPSKVKGLFRPLQPNFANRPAWGHFWRLVLALCVSHGATIDRLTRAMRAPGCHRTKHGEFLWKSRWDEAHVVQRIALDTLRRLYRSDGGPVYLIIDETQTIKRGKRMQAVGKLYHHATGRYCRGHTLLKVCLHYRGVTIPWGTWLYVKQEDAPKLKVPFRKLTELAAGQAVRDARLPGCFGNNVIVLFDAYYLCPNVVEACRARGWHYIGAGKGNRNFHASSGQWHKLGGQRGGYGRNVLGRSGAWHVVRGIKNKCRYKLAERVGRLKKLGDVKVVFSKRKADRKVVALVTDDLRATARTVVAHYLKRWSIELLIKDEKQQLGLGDYRVLRCQAVVRHLHLVDCAYGCLTHVALKQELRAQGEAKKTVLHLPPISQLKATMRQMIWDQAVEDVIKHSHERPVIRRLELLRAAA